MFPPNLKGSLVVLKIIRLADSLPCDDTGERGIRPGDTQESAKVLRTDGSVGNVDAKANHTREKTGKDEWPAQLQLVRIVGEEQQNNRWEKIIIRTDRHFSERTNSLAKAYGGTVRRFEAATENPNPRMIEGRKSDIP